MKITNILREEDEFPFPLILK